MNSSKDTQILVTGRLWLGADGARSIGSSLIEILSSAKQEVIIVAYRLTIGVPEFVAAIEAVLARGCYVRIIRDRPAEVVDVEERFINRLLNEYTTVSVWDFQDHENSNPMFALHAKMVVIDRSIAIVGSANFSKNGMLDNHEIAVKVSGKEAKSLGIVCDRLIENGMKEGVLIQRKIK